MKFAEYLRDLKDLTIATIYNISFQHKSLACLLIFLFTVTLTVNGDRAFTTSEKMNDAASIESPVDIADQAETAPIRSESNDQSPVTANTVQTSTYTVKSGDTLWDIAIACKTTVEQIIALNNLNGENLSIGQQLLVAGTVPQSQENKPVQIAKRSDPAVSRSGQSSQAGPTTSVVKKAAQYLNTPYVWGGARPGGFDCSGFVQYVFGQCGYKLPRTAADQASAGSSVSRKNLAPGDLVYFSTGGGGIDHIGIYVGNNKFIHSSSPRSGGVIYTSLSESYYANSYAGATRVTK